MMRSFFALVGALLGFAGSPDPHAAPATPGAGRAGGALISGQVTLPGGRKASEAVVYFEGGEKAKPATNAVVDQRNKTFFPHVTVVPCGSKVQFPNNDTVFHNVFAYFKAKKFDLGMYPRGASKTVTLDKPGLVALLCNVHSDMSAYIMIVDTPYYAVTDRQGHFSIRGVSPGTYTLRAWHESGATATQSVTISGNAAPLSVSLARH